MPPCRRASPRALYKEDNRLVEEIFDCRPGRKTPIFSSLSQEKNFLCRREHVKAADVESKLQQAGGHNSSPGTDGKNGASTHSTGSRSRIIPLFQAARDRIYASQRCLGSPPPFCRLWAHAWRQTSEASCSPSFALRSRQTLSLVVTAPPPIMTIIPALRIIRQAFKHQILSLISLSEAAMFHGPV